MIYFLTCYFCICCNAKNECDLNACCEQCCCCFTDKKITNQANDLNKSYTQF